MAAATRMDMTLRILLSLYNKEMQVKIRHEAT
jgi:hypothetical protein